MKKIIDYFPFFIEKELLELRVNLLKDYVDKFIISETNKTHNGEDKEFICNKIIDELNLPKDKIQVIETIIPEEEFIAPEDCDYFYSLEAKSSKVKNWSRERIQRDALMNYIDEYDDDTVFILSDCDEIINPEFLPYFSNYCRQLESNFIKVPLVLLEGRADKRLYDGEIPADWSKSLVLCTKKHLKPNGSPTKFRGCYNSPFLPIWITENNQIIQDCGWHFTWMGDENLKKYKARTTVLSDNLSELNTLSSSSMKSIVGNYDNNLSLKDYPLELLPQIIFKLPMVKDFLLPNEKKFSFKKNIFSSKKSNADEKYYEISKKIVNNEIWEKNKLISKGKTNFEPKLKFNFLSNNKNTAWIVDNFYDNPDEIRKFALEQEFGDESVITGFVGRRTFNQFLFPGLKEAFESVMGKKITKWEEHGMNGRFQICWSGERLVYHCDSQKWGGMIYLTPNAPYQCGTTLYADKKNRARTYYDPGWDEYWANTPGDCHLDRTPFEPVDVLGNVYNRLVIFDASCIHSASEYFGTNKDNARLWQMFFFDTEN
jgi:hypothetical protein